MEDQLEKILAKLERMEVSQQEVGNRLVILEERGPGSELQEEKPEVKPADIVMNTDSTNYAHNHGREKRVIMTFGDEDTSPTSLILFLDHYEIARQQNLAKHVPGWGCANFRANELRYQMRGEVAMWISQESAMLNAEWTKDDEEIIKRLKTRFMGTQCIELNIMSFEDLRQDESESLASYMTRCQRRGMEAFGEMDPASTQQRIVWKFLSGIRDQNVRSQVIKEKWMASNREAKNYQEVLKIAETARMHHMATNATAPGGSQPKAKVAAMTRSRVKDRREGSRHNSSESAKSSYSNSSSNSISSGGTSSSSGSMPNFRCHYCNTTEHFGGWKFCKKRQDSEPNWTPGKGAGAGGAVKKKKGFQ